MDCAPKVCIAVINREKSSLARECARTSAHFGLIRRIKRDEKKCRLIGKWRCWILARLFECAPLRTHGHFEKIDYESQSWRNGCCQNVPLHKSWKLRCVQGGRNMSPQRRKSGATLQPKRKVSFREARTPWRCFQKMTKNVWTHRRWKRKTYFLT